MTDRRKKNSNWYVANEEGRAYTEGMAGQTVAVLMDIRDELQDLNRLLSCPNFISIPALLRAIQRNTRRPKRQKAAPKKKHSTR